MRITLEFGNAEKFFTELPKFGKVIELASQYVDFQHVDKDGRDINIVPKDAPDAVASPEAAAPVPPVTSAAPAAPVAPIAPPVPPKAAQEPMNPPAVAPAAVPVAEHTYSLNDLAKAGMALMDAGRDGDLRALLQSFGVEALPSLPKDQYGAFATALRGMGAPI
ncbi:MAG: hypothetical protein MR671_04805 [Clostridiales bacterium]|nr:hypothetical protein [Clostridiales bacterium]